MDKVRCMVYVNDVEAVVTFWQDYLDARIVAVNAMPDGSSNVVLQVMRGVELAFFSKAFIKQYSPEVATNLPSLMFFSDHFDELHRRIPGAGKVVDQHGQLTFNFPDPEGNYFVIAQV
ncbi:glyoxalase [Lactiplantibacillus garii]|uniref:Glyoxalase n=1 Tax=Lactiplantibacillus garii TaxID=2306423 RepID=A0A426D7J2_9LACO|nr:VOC family protein [Lactiplantibacillus garii]RRK10568.1 glyoxalase [Lactiplantibacillus garii]